MMFYIWTIAIPVLMLIFGFVYHRNEHWTSKGILKIAVKNLPFQYLYTLALYAVTIMEYENMVWEFYSMLIFLIPISVVLLGIYLVLRLRGKV